MAASANGAVALGLLAALALGGCVSTQHKNERAKLRATRILEGRKAHRVTVSNLKVEVENSGLVRGRERNAVVVELRSGATEPLTDVPVTVGVRTKGGKRVVLNGRKGLGWFATHVPSIGAGETTTWVFTTPRKVPAGRAWARVGESATPVGHAEPTLPRINARATAPKAAATDGAPAVVRDDVTGAVQAGGPSVRVVVQNVSQIPQYALQVYAVVRAGGRYVAAGQAEVDHLGTAQRKAAQVPLVGRARELRPEVHAAPTIFE